MTDETTPLTDSGATQEKSLVEKLLTVIAIIGAVALLGESSLAATHHIQRVQYSRLVADLYAFLSGIGVIGIQLNESNALKQWLHKHFPFLKTSVGIALFYAFGGSFELTRVSYCNWTLLNSLTKNIFSYSNFLTLLKYPSEIFAL